MRHATQSTPYRLSRNLLAAAILALPGFAQAATYTVTNLNDSGPGSLRQAIADAKATPDDDTIAFAPALASGSVITLASKLVVDGDVADSGKLRIEGERRITLSGNDAVRVLDVGGGADLTLDRLAIVAGNTASEGPSTSGGGIDCDGWGPGGTLTLIGSSVRDSRSDGFGGGVNAFRCSLTLIASTVSGNRAVQSGGGINVNHGDLTLNGSTVSGNQVDYLFGGGIYAFGSNVSLLNSTVSGNQAEAGGGGIGFAAAGSSWLKNLTLASSTVFANRTTQGASGVFVKDLPDRPAQAILANTVIAGNEGGADCAVAVAGISGDIHAHHSLIGSGLGCVNGDNLYNLTGDAHLGPLADNGGPTRTHAVLPGSQVIDAGDGDWLPLNLWYDQRGAGFPRVVGLTADIGAVEYSDVIFASGFENASSAEFVDDRVVFLSRLRSGYHEEDFDDVPVGESASLDFAGNGFAWTVTAIDPNHPAPILYVGPGVISTNSATSALRITFTGAPVTAVGGNFWGTDLGFNPTNGAIALELADGTTHYFTSSGPSGFGGFVSESPIEHITIDALDGAFQQWPTMDNLVVGRRE